MESKTYEIIPDLVSIESSVKTIRGSYFFKELNLCPITNQKNRFHYKLNLQNNVYVPTKYDFRNGYYFKNGSYWYYQRTLFKNITLKLKFDPREKTFYFNRLYHLIPFEIGGIFPAGKHIADLINLDLSLSGFDVIRGLAFRYQEQVICCVIPSFNGKTSLMKKILESGGEYIAEDILVINHRDSTVYPTPPIGDNYGRKINSELRDEAIKKRLKKGQKINKMYLLHNSTSSNEKNLGGIDFFNYFMMNSLLFLNNGFIKSYIFTEKLWDQILKKVDHAKRYQNKYHTLHIKEFIFDELITLVDEKNRSHWEKMGGSYNKAWTNPAKQTLNQKELNFIEQSLRRVNPEKVLDIGVGNGRLIESILNNSSG